MVPNGPAPERNGMTRPPQLVAGEHERALVPKAPPVIQLSCRGRSKRPAKLTYGMPKPLRLGTPVWLDRRSRRQTYQSLRGHHEVDVAIVGGGITGSAVAALFAMAGIRIGLVEAALVGRGSTAASTALLLREPDLGLRDLGRRYGAARARRIWQLSADATRDFVRTIRRLEIECELTKRDSVYYTLAPESVPELHAEYARRCSAGFAGDWLTPGALRRLTGISGRGAIRTRDNGGRPINVFSSEGRIVRWCRAAGAPPHSGKARENCANISTRCCPPWRTWASTTPGKACSR